MLLGILIFLEIFFAVQAQWGSGNVNCKTPDNKSGLCIPVTTCRTMQEFLASVPRPIPADIREKLKPYQCGNSGGKPKICCPENPIEFDKPIQLDHFEFPDVSQHRNIDLLPKTCGHQDTVDKVVGGNKTGLTEFPWMALLSYQSNSGPGFKCGGTILNERYILTAAHCVTNLENTREKLKLNGVRVGEHDLRTVNDCETFDDEEFCNPPVQDLSIEEVISHRDYNSRSHANDIALIRVSKIDLKQENSRPVCLPFGDTGNFNYTGRNLVVTGWGIADNGRPSPELLKAEIPVVGVKECAEKYKKISKITEKQLCAGGNGPSDSCSGDSGGPLHSLEALYDRNRFIQQGIVSFGPSECGKIPLPGVYTRVAFYMDWILDNIKP